MCDRVILLGSEDVRAAGYTMMQAAQEMRSAASSIDLALQLQRVFMDEWLQRLEVVMRGDSDE